MSYCPLKGGSCHNTCAWAKEEDYGCSFISALSDIGENLKAINSKLIEPNLEEIQKTKEINMAIALNNIETQKKTAALLDVCQSFIKEEQARAQLEQERWEG